MTTELGGSELGTKEYWDSAYKLELDNYKDHGDVGDVWFGEDSALRVIKWMSSSDDVSTDDSIVDLGCGNGMMLIELAREGFTNLTGVDYSEAAVKLAEAVALSQELKINYEVCDILADSLSPLNGKKFQIVLDKGTYDAISLNPENTSEKRSSYIDAVNSLLDSEGLFILTSCNWTQPELETQFRKYFTMYHAVPTPKFFLEARLGMW